MVRPETAVREERAAAQGAAVWVEQAVATQVRLPGQEAPERAARAAQMRAQARRPVPAALAEAREAQLPRGAPALAPAPRRVKTAAAALATSRANIAMRMVSRFSCFSQA